MFNSIRFRFISIYFLLVLICMTIVGAFIINRLEVVQIQRVTSQMKQSLDSIENTSAYLSNEDWQSKKDEIYRTINAWQISQSDTIYAIAMVDNKPVIISSTSNAENINTARSALTHKALQPNLILNAFKGNEDETIVIGGIDELNAKHLVKPIFSSSGHIQGILYMTSNLSEVYDVVDKARSILTYATLIALVITSILG